MLEKLARIVREAGTLITAACDINIQEKEGHANYVTNMDMAVQAYLQTKLTALIPESCFIGEEAENNQLTDQRTWIVDPIDGTTNFIHSFQHSAVSVALTENGKPVMACIYNPFTNELFSAEKGHGAYLNGKPIHVSNREFSNAIIGFGTSPYQEELARPTMELALECLRTAGDIRRCGSAALDLAYVACGRLDSFFELILNPWDYAAGALLVTEAGGNFTQPKNEQPQFDDCTAIVAGNALCCEKTAEMVRKTLALYDL